MAIDYSKPIEEVENISIEDFVKNYYIPQIPVKIKGLLKDSPAFTKWTPEYFKKELGNVEVGVFETGEDLLDRPYNEPPEHMKFSEYLDLIEAGPSNKRLFLFNVFKQKKELYEDIKIPKVSNWILNSTLFCFFGGAGSYTRLHRDADNSNVFLSEFYGEKRVVLFSSDYDKLLYKYPMSIHSGVDIENPDYEKHPGLAYVKGQHTILKKGETLFMPAKYWHFIRYIKPGIGLSFRSLAKFPVALEALSFVGFTMHLDKFLRKSLGNRWFEYKERKAHERADKIINDLKLKMEAV